VEWLAGLVVEPGQELTAEELAAETQPAAEAQPSPAAP
jgi:hypothetical protein